MYQALVESLHDQCDLQQRLLGGAGVAVVRGIAGYLAPGSPPLAAWHYVITRVERGGETALSGVATESLLWYLEGSFDSIYPTFMTFWEKLSAYASLFVILQLMFA